MNDELARHRIQQWRYLKLEKQAAIQRLKAIVSKLVNKVEEMMDIAMGQTFPSVTLLGDFGDTVTVRANQRTAEITGLRPGTSYQFKVAAVSRMGEGPFSVASEPAGKTTYIFLLFSFNHKPYHMAFSLIMYSYKICSHD
ncbi:hypothetical protein B5M09_009778 [Aphanomyces astaci]|uniref:Fibronectin type-III domain-containing protein n=1 Tax=Aphanomyces astaci TaxID=112090 RepID=A0A3R7YST7_APHAT|nr:hypothetical protein B5M09_009778 [Aphanomyces astaci]